MRLRLLLTVVAAAAVVTGAGSASSKPPWTVMHTKGAHYTVRFTQPAGGQTANAFAIEDDRKTADPVTAMSAPGESCQAYAAMGSFYCSGAALAAGQAIVFRVTLQAAIAASVGWQMCWSPDNLVTNNCSDVKTTSSGPSLHSAARSAIGYISSALALEEHALHDPAGAPKDLLRSHADLSDAHDDIRPFDNNKGGPVYDAVDALNIAMAADRQAYGDFKKGETAKGDSLIEEAVQYKQKALAHLRPLR